MKTYCPNCDLETNHYVRGEFKPSDVYTTSSGINEANEYFIVQCKGCDRVGFLNLEYLYNDGENRGEAIENHYPDNNEYFSFLSTEDVEELPEPLYSLYDELQSALLNYQYISSGALFRMLLEATCEYKKKEGEIPDKKIVRLKDIGLISDNDFQVLNKVYELGNISIHQAKALTDDEIDATLEAINHLLRIVFIVSKRTENLKNKRKSKINE